MAIKLSYLTIVENSGIDTERGDIGQFAKGQSAKQIVVEYLRQCVGTRVGPTAGQFLPRPQAASLLNESGREGALHVIYECVLMSASSRSGHPSSTEE